MLVPSRWLDQKPSVIRLRKLELSPVRTVDTHWLHIGNGSATFSICSGLIPICQKTLTVNFTNSELQRHGMDVESLLADPAVRKFVDWVANKDPDFTAPLAKKQR